MEHSDCMDDMMMDVRPIGDYLDKNPDDIEKKDLVDFIFENGIEILTLAPVTGEGRLKNLSFPVTKRKRIEEILEMGERVDGSSHFAGLPAERSDIYVVPRYSTAFLNPFSERLNLVLLTSCFNMDEEPLSICPAHLVRRAEETFEKTTGLSFKAFGELEFYLIGDESSDSLNSGFGGPAKLYQENTPFVKYHEIRDEIMSVIASLGIPVKYGHAEVGGAFQGSLYREQHEIELFLESASKAADHLAISKWVVRNIADMYGLYATFSPKIDTTLAGSGLHFHFQVLRDGKNILFTDDGAITPEGKGFVGSILMATPALTAFGNTVPLSYLRFTPNQEAPTNITWGASNRSALVRVPLGWNKRKNMAGAVNPSIKTRSANLPDNRTAEFRAPDGSANAHHTLAGMLVAIRKGFEDPKYKDIADKLQYVKGAEPEHVENHPVLPRSCAESLEALKKNRALFEEKGVFTPELIDSVMKVLETRQRDVPVGGMDKDPEKTREIINKYMYCG